MQAIDYIRNLASSGKNHFSTEEAIKQIGGSTFAVRAMLRRLKKKGLIATPYRGFHVIVPAEYQRLKCLPAEQFIPQLMKRLKESYYAGLLSAAQYHGAAHQRPQVFQVVVSKQRRPIHCGQVDVAFVMRNNAKDIPTIRVNTPRGEVAFSTPEATAFDLVGYPQHCGGFGNVATVLKELAEKLDPKVLGSLARLSPVPWTQRLGYVLDLIDESKLAAPLQDYLRKSTTETVPLSTERPKGRAKRDPRWKLAVNIDVEPDL